MYIYFLIALSIYPPLIVFVFPVLIADLWNIKQTLGGKTFLKFGAGIVGTLIILVAIFLVILFSHQDRSLFSVFLGYMIRPNLDLGIPAYYVWNIVPIFFLLFSIPGIYFAFKKRFYVLLAPSLVGMMYWIVYLYLSKVIIIEYPRIIFVTSIYIIIFSCIGIDESIKRAKLPHKTYVIVGSVCILLSILLLPRYSSGQAWKKLALTVYDTTGRAHVFIPTSPVTSYLTEDDLELFKNIHGESFMAPPWKGLTIGVVTGNFPLETKPSTITNQILGYNEFMSFDCDTKARVFAFIHATYAYTQPFSCPQFRVIGTSTEGLYLSEFMQK